MIRTITCLIVACDDCTTEWWEAPDGDSYDGPHWGSVEEALDEMSEDEDRDGWRFLGTVEQFRAGQGTALCPGCYARRICGEVGEHAFGPPIDCRCGGTTPAHADGCIPWQICGRCGHHEPAEAAEQAEQAEPVEQSEPIRPVIPF